MGKRIKCYSVRLQSLEAISAKCYKATAFDGSTALVPMSQVFNTDRDVENSDAWWIAAWFIEKPELTLQVSRKKIGWFDRESGRMLPNYTVERHVPEPKEAVERGPIPELRKA